MISPKQAEPITTKESQRQLAIAKSDLMKARKEAETALDDWQGLYPERYHTQERLENIGLKL